MNVPFYTIGHSTRTIAQFVRLLRLAHVDLIADIRTVPRSRTNPQYNGDTLPESLVPFQIGYEYIAELGGLRPKSHEVPPETNAYWINDSFHNYADYALSDGFRNGLSKLVALGRERRCAVMCAEVVWWRCHRRIVSDYLLASGETVFHLMSEDRIEPARLTPGAFIRDGGVLYPAVSEKCAAED
ncbi:DUF488 domain-containing protein (plasmid) [Phyllobacterium sp. A18/5-2]|uniref:DUF488 domain-containing protein n=1 Tax=Phyllobacterium sp. A18/5-2 TaxID=2978392 RepID=UPI0021C69D99|nr:DUF488 domain-containing protein [Phyllobacterium sp. A18/5-2]UXN66090.1 DUF488 domain-containing protein [Phyllobacterium sp. A18/5-2]